MNKADISEIRRRLNPDKNSIDCIRGCYVDEKGEIISMFTHSLLTLPQEEAEKYLTIFRKTLSGLPGKNLVDISFRPDQVMDGEEHRLLTAMKNTSLKVDQAVERFFHTVIENLEFEGNYLILLMHDNYDVPFRAKDEYKVDVVSEDMFQYILCAVCPVKMTKPALCYCPDDKGFHDRDLEWIVSAPDLGFMFPAFEDGGANIYSALYYTRDAAENHQEFVTAVFDGKAPMPAAEQKEVFEALLGDTLEEECSLEVVQTVHEQIRDMIEERKQEKAAEPATVSKKEVGTILKSCGVSEEHVQAFEERYDEEFGPAMDLSAQNIVNVKQFELRTPDVMIKVNPERSDLVQTRMIDGSKYILIRADEGVEVNGVNISIADLGEDVEENDEAPF
ncbi:MAG: DUF4317 domain-containing protein [Clostridia bacterium]|nr:DUF4317 domain-containing protein [Clostridia bacterium]MBP3651646.1 DUF4317 domain-containing protein [Clostridia bacterium]